MHLGGLRTALYNYLLAKKHGGDFILRIEDTDASRFVPEAEQYIIDSLKWCGIEPNEGIGFGDGPCGPYRQSERSKAGIYLPFVKELLDKGNAYYAFDTKEELEAVKFSGYGVKTRMGMKNSLTYSKETVDELLAKGTPYVVRMKMPENAFIKFKDKVRGNISVKSSDVDDKVLFKSDGMPSYHLANVVDDHLMEITHVLRGEEWLPSCPLHVYLYDCFGWERPVFVHLPLILGPNGKLSKRDAESGLNIFPLNVVRDGKIIKGYKELGYFPEAFMNMLALIGWNPGGNIEYMKMDDLIEKFSLEKLNKAGAKFDAKKAEWFNRTHMLKMSNEAIADFWIKSGFEPGSHELTEISKICGMLKEKFWTVDSFNENGRYFFDDPNVDEYMNFSPMWALDFAKVLCSKIDSLESFKHDEIKRCFDETCKELNLQARDAGMHLRTMMTGLTMGPPVFDIMEHLGKETCVNRILLTELVHDAILKNPDKVDEYKEGKTGLAGLLMGEVMKNSNGKADPKATNKLLTRYLS